MSKLVSIGFMTAASLAAMSCTTSAQIAAQTSGGDVTADEATPLPPVVVQAPKERRKPARKPSPSSPPAAASSSAQSGGAAAADAALASDGSEEFPSGPVGVFTLGQLDLIGGSTITNEAMWTYNKQSLDQAVDILPGVAAYSAGGSRNEKDIFVRGFDRFRVPLSVDGVRVYLPADNRLDFKRFLTPDIAEVQVQKGYVSVLNGPGGMGGAINLVSRKPTKEVELEGRAGAVFDGDLSSLGQWNSYAFAGTRQTGWYAQVSGNITDQDHFFLSEDFRPEYRPFEDGNDRDHSDFEDWRINAKIGITPNATDEYVLNYTKQASERSAPLHVQGAHIQGARFWEWPQWDLGSLSWLSKTQLGSASYVKTNAYYNTFDNILRAFNTIDYGTRQFDSIYDDYAYGGFVEFGTELIPMNTLKGAIHYRRDSHTEHDHDNPDTAFFAEPEHQTIDDTWSFSLENTFHATSRLDVVMGVSYDNSTISVAEEFGDPVTPNNNPNDDVLYNLPTPKTDGWNFQGAAIYSYSDTGKAYASISDRIRFATLFERFSTRFGAITTPNPFLAPEESINYEIGFSDTFFRSLKASGAVFYSDLKDSIQPVFIATGRNGIRNENIDGEIYGFETSLDWRIMPTLRVGGNYTFIERSYEYEQALAKPEGLPKHKAFLYASWDATSKLTITPSLELSSDRTGLINGCGSTLWTAGGYPANCTAQGIPRVGGPIRPNYTDIGAYTRLNLQAEYRFTDTTSAAIGATNLLDENYEIAEGFPEAGRQYFLNVRSKF